MKLSVHRTAAAVVILSLTIVSGCKDSSSVPSNATRPNVLWVVVDPVRADVGSRGQPPCAGSTRISVVMRLPTVGPSRLQALKGQDIFMAGFILLFVSILTLVGMLISDLLLALLDPRIRLSSKRRGT